MTLIFNSMRLDEYLRQRTVSSLVQAMVYHVWGQGITWTNSASLSVGPPRINFSELLNKMQIFSLNKCISKCPNNYKTIDLIFARRPPIRQRDISKPWKYITVWMVLGKCGSCNFQTHIKERYRGHYLWDSPQMNVEKPHWRSASIGSGKGLVPSGNKPLSEPMMSKFYVTLWRH